MVNDTNFVTPVFYQAIVLEGSYWKRRIEVVIKEYHKWRIYYKKRVIIHTLFLIYCIFPLCNRMCTLLLLQLQKKKDDILLMFQEVRQTQNPSTSILQFNFVLRFKFTTMYRNTKVMVRDMSDWPSPLRLDPWPANTIHFCKLKRITKVLKMAIFRTFRRQSTMKDSKKLAKTTCIIVKDL